MLMKTFAAVWLRSRGILGREGEPSGQGAPDRVDLGKSQKDYAYHTVGHAWVRESGLPKSPVSGKEARLKKSSYRRC